MLLVIFTVNPSSTGFAGTVCRRAAHAAVLVLDNGDPSPLRFHLIQLVQQLRGEPLVTLLSSVLPLPACHVQRTAHRAAVPPCPSSRVTI